MREISERLVRNKMKYRRVRESRDLSSYEKEAERMLNLSLGSHETGVTVEEIQVISETPDTITFKVDYSVDIRIPSYDEESENTYYEDDVEYRTRTLVIEK